MNKYSIEDKILMIQNYFENKKSVSAAIRKFCNEKKIKKSKDYPSYSTVNRLITKFLSTGSVANLKQSGRPLVGEDKVQQIKCIIDEANSSGKLISVRTLAVETAIPTSTVYKILTRELSLYPYKYSLVQTLSSAAITSRLLFCQEFIKKMENDVDYLERILFTDECNFYVNGFVNKQNVRFWGSEKPNLRIEKAPFCQKVTVWCGISYRFVVGPFFFDSGTVNGDGYRDMIESFLIPHLKSHRRLTKTIYMQDGATPHTAKKTRDLLEANFPSGVISRFTTFEWPSHSPDLNPCDYFLWGFMKDSIYGPNQVYNVTNLKENIEKCFKELPTYVIKSAITNIHCRVTKCIDQNGKHFE